MSTRSNVWIVLAIVLASTSILTSTIAIYYYTSYNSLENRYTDTLATLDGLSYIVNILIKYNNETYIWYNQTRIPIGWSLLQATNKTTEGQLIGQKFSFGTFVTSINGVHGEGPAYWIAYRWYAQRWNLIEFSSDQYALKQNEITAWYLTEDWNKTP